MIFHLAGVVSGEAETDFEKGYRVNLDGTRALLEAIRAAGGGYKPKVVFTSSIAVFGAPFPDAIPDDFHLTPLTSYGTQKAICELLLADYTRRGFLDGVGIRLPTICVRPGKPNKAASGFFSGIIREPLAGQEAMLPVADSVLHTHASPRSAVGFLIHAAGLTRAQLGRPHQPHHAGRVLHGRRADRSACDASPATRWSPASAARPTNWSNASSPAGRSRFDARRARSRSASRSKRRSTTSSARISRTNWAARSPNPLPPGYACTRRANPYIEAHDLRRRRRRPPPQDRPDQDPRSRRLRRHAQGRPAGGPLPRHADRPCPAGRADRKNRPAGVRLCDRSRRAAGDADVSRLQEVHLHLAQSRGLPRHSRRQAAEGRRHRQYRRDADPRRLARQFQPHVRRSAKSRAAPSG